jgi:uncharacterized protein (TIRG00374 family)
MIIKKSYILKSLFILVGLGMVIYLANKLGFDSILQNLKTLSWRAIPLLFLAAIWYFSYTLAWDQFLKQLKGSIGLWELFRAKIAGEAVNSTTPASFLGGDPVRIYILRKHFPLTEAAASVVVDRTLHTMAVLILIFLGMIAAFWKLPFLPLNMRYGLPIILIICSLFMGLVFTHQRRGLFTFLMYLLKKLHIKKSFSTKTIYKFKELDGHISDFYINNPGSFWTALSLHFFGRLLGIVEIYAVGKIFYPEFTVYAALLLGALAPIIIFLFAFIPGALGVLEGAYSGILYLLHIPPEVGLSIQIFRRIRAFFWIIIGYIALGTHERKKILHPDVIENIQPSS